MAPGAGGGQGPPASELSLGEKHVRGCSRWALGGRQPPPCRRGRGEAAPPAEQGSALWELGRLLSPLGLGSTPSLAPARPLLAPPSQPQEPPGGAVTVSAARQPGGPRPAPAGQDHTGQRLQQPLYNAPTLRQGSRACPPAPGPRWTEGRLQQAQAGRASLQRPLCRSPGPLPSPLSSPGPAPWGEEGPHRPLARCPQDPAPSRALRSPT